MTFKDTIILPKTDFSMKANLPELEKRLLAYWQSIHLYQKISDKTKGRPQFILNDGPPYANGHLHMGHALNKILKDVVLKYQRLMGKDCPFIPVWDCHGLPIEWKIEEAYKAKNLNKDQLPILQFRQECRDFAQKWVDIQRAESQLLGVFGDWDHPCLTMDHEAEAQIVEELHKILINVCLYKGLKPVQWSVVEKTALAEAEVEYHDKVSPSIYVRFPLSTHLQGLKNVSAVIWTTTPWTLPGNRAIAYGEDIQYVIAQMDDRDPFFVAKDRVEDFAKEIGAKNVTVLKTLSGKDLSGLQAWHPLRENGYDFTVPLVPGSHVTTVQGTGLVHIAPSHGLEDFEVGKQRNLEIPNYVGEDGTYNAHTPSFAGTHIFKANPLIIEALKNQGALVWETTLTHSYPHSWRSKAPLIFRATPQWFISMEATHLRHKALTAIENVQWVPAQSKNRLTAMIKDRPDWCLSRQRAWGVPLAIFVSKETGEPLKDPAVNARICKLFAEHSSDIWYSADSSVFLGPDYDAQDYEKTMDILDVWFESGASYAFVLEKKPDLKFPADLYLEGSDQHRGWFQSSLLVSCATRDEAPYKAVMTHGFIVNEHGHKMSKSLGNAINVEDVLARHGADILRIVVLSSNYTEDLKISMDGIKRQEEVYRKIRNTLRYLLGNLQDFQEKDCLEYDQLPPLEQWVLGRLADLYREVQECTKTYNYHHLFVQLYNFCVIDLSAFYFDVRKDCLYCESRSSQKYQAVLTVLHYLFNYLCLWFSPILSFTMEEAWQTRHPNTTVFLEDMKAIPSQWHNEALAAQWDVLRNVRRVVTGAIELERNKGTIRSSLEAQATLFVTDSTVYDILSSLPLAELMIVSNIVLIPQEVQEGFMLADVPFLRVQVSLATGEKCERCWRILEEVGTLVPTPTLCCRCADAVKTYD